MIITTILKSDKLRMIIRKFCCYHTLKRFDYRKLIIIVIYFLLFFALLTEQKIEKERSGKREEKKEKEKKKRKKGRVGLKQWQYKHF